MAASSEKLDFLPIHAPVADSGRSSIAAAYHYSFTGTSALTNPASGPVSGATCTESERDK